jgi:hypothetical protein
VGDGSSRELTGARTAGMYAIRILDPDDKLDSRYVPREDDWNGERISYLSEVLAIMGEKSS